MKIDVRGTVHTDYLLDRGIDRIVYDEPASMELPEGWRLLPWEFGHLSELQRLLQPPSLDTLLDEAVRPFVSDRLLLSPANFRSVLASAEGFLHAHATGDAESDKVLKRAARELGDHTSLYGLLLRYWNALVQG